MVIGHLRPPEGSKDAERDKLIRRLEAHIMNLEEEMKSKLSAKTADEIRASILNNRNEMVTYMNTLSKSIVQQKEDILSPIAQPPRARSSSSAGPSNAPASSTGPITSPLSDRPQSTTAAAPTQRRVASDSGVNTPRFVAILKHV